MCCFFVSSLKRPKQFVDAYCAPFRFYQQYLIDKKESYGSVLLLGTQNVSETYHIVTWLWYVMFFLAMFEIPSLDHPLICTSFFTEKIQPVIF